MLPVSRFSPTLFDLLAPSDQAGPCPLSGTFDRRVERMGLQPFGTAVVFRFSTAAFAFGRRWPC